MSEGKELAVQQTPRHQGEFDPEWKDDYPDYITSKDGKIGFLWEKVQFHRDEVIQLREAITSYHHQMERLKELHAEREREYQIQLAVQQGVVSQLEQEVGLYRAERAQLAVEKQLQLEAGEHMSQDVEVEDIG